MYKKQIVLTLWLLLVAGSSNVLASGLMHSFYDGHLGNAIEVIVVDGYITVKYHFEPEWDKSTDGGKVKYSFPFPDDGFFTTVGGEKFVATVGFIGYDDILAEYIVPPGGKGPLVFKVKNPMYSNEVLVVVSISLNGEKKQWLCVPWDPRYFYWATPDKNHPGGAQHTTAFLVEGDGFKFLSKEEAKMYGFESAHDYHLKDEMIKNGGVDFNDDGKWTRKNALKGIPPYN